ncbi:MAG TPA: MFS transporter [Ramlibacter sp.]|nr:MFS transporter [Ramlibacter sp.]
MTDTTNGNRVGAELARILTGHVFLHAAMTGLRMAAPLLALGQGYGAAHAGILVALFAMTQVFMSLPAGRLADRFGLRRPMAFSIAGAAVGAALAAIWPIYPVLCASALITGGSVGVGTIAMQRHVGRMAQSATERRQVFSWMSLAPAASNFLGPFAAGLVIDSFGFRPAFAMLSISALSGWLWIRTARELPDEHASAAQRGTAWELWRDPVFRRLMVMNWFFSSSWDVHGFMVPVLGHERGLSAAVIGSILGAFAIAAALVRLGLPVVAARMQEWVIITLATASAGLMLALYPSTSGPLTMGLCSAFIGMALGAAQPMILSALHQVTPSHRHGQAVAMRALMINASSVTMPMVFGAAGGVLGAAAVFWAMGLILGCGSRLGLALRGTGEHEEPPR